MNFLLNCFSCCRGSFSWRAASSLKKGADVTRERPFKSQLAPPGPISQDQVYAPANWIRIAAGGERLKDLDSPCLIQYGDHQAQFSCGEVNGMSRSVEVQSILRCCTSLLGSASCRLHQPFSSQRSPKKELTFAETRLNHFSKPYLWNVSRSTLGGNFLEPLERSKNIAVEDPTHQKVPRKQLRDLPSLPWGTRNLPKVDWSRPACHGCLKLRSLKGGTGDELGPSSISPKQQGNHHKNRRDTINVQHNDTCTLL